MLDSTRIAPSLVSSQDEYAGDGFPDFTRDLEFFGERILRLMKQAGLRIDAHR